MTSFALLVCHANRPIVYKLSVLIYNHERLKLLPLSAFVFAEHFKHTLDVCDPGPSDITPIAAEAVVACLLAQAGLERVLMDIAQRCQASSALHSARISNENRFKNLGGGRVRVLGRLRRPLAVGLAIYAINLVMLNGFMLIVFDFSILDLGLRTGIDIIAISLGRLFAALLMAKNRNLKKRKHRSCSLSASVRRYRMAASCNPRRTLWTTGG
jgi:hypothetical protein